MTSSLHSASSSPTAETSGAKPVGIAWRFAWLLLSGVGMVLWLQYPNGPWQVGVLLLGVSGLLVAPRGSYKQSVPARAAVLSIGAILLLALSPIAAYFIFGWSLRQHPYLILAIKLAGVLVWLMAAVHQLRVAFAGRRNSPAA